MGGLTLPVCLGLPGNVPCIAHPIVLFVFLDDAELGVVREEARVMAVQPRDVWWARWCRSAGELRSRLGVEAHAAGVIPRGDVVAPGAH